MARSEVIQAVQDRLAAKWTETAVFGINLEGDTPGDGSVYVELQFPISRTEAFDVASSRYVEEGTIRIIVMAERGGGLTDGLGMTDRLAALFRGKKFSGVQTFAPSSPTVDDRNDNGVYYPISVSVPYRYVFADESGFFD